MSKHRRALKRRGPFVTPLFRYPGKGRVDVCTYPEEAVAPGDSPLGPYPCVCCGRRRLKGHERGARHQDEQYPPRRAAPGSWEQRSGDTVTVEFTFEGEEDD
jgi:hypothetical protein